MGYNEKFYGELRDRHSQGKSLIKKKKKHLNRTPAEIGSEQGNSVPSGEKAKCKSPKARVTMSYLRQRSCNWRRVSKRVEDKVREEGKGHIG